MVQSGSGAEDLVRRESLEDPGRAAGDQGAEEAGAQAMHVNERQGQTETVVGLRVPGYP